MRSSLTLRGEAFYVSVSSLRFLDDMAQETGASTGVNEVIDQYYSSTLESVDLAESEILKAAEEAGFDEDELHRIGMAVRECMVNAVVHGNRYNRNKTVHIGVHVERPEQPDGNAARPGVRA